jgi:hypothetical protein
MEEERGRMEWRDRLQNRVEMFDKTEQKTINRDEIMKMI